MQITITYLVIEQIILTTTFTKIPMRSEILRFLVILSNIHQRSRLCGISWLNLWKMHTVKLRYIRHILYATTICMMVWRKFAIQLKMFHLWLILLAIMVIRLVQRIIMSIKIKFLVRELMCGSMRAVIHIMVSRCWLMIIYRW